eukprot:8075037-Prorocentrum_lima.AAC.1
MLWRGGIIAELLKKLKLVSLLSSYRAIILADHLSKLFVRSLLSEAETYLKSAVASSQYGYGYSAGTYLPLLQMRLWRDLVRTAKLSWAILFVDVSAAFTHASRFLLFGSPLSRQQVAQQLFEVEHDEQSVDFLLEEVFDRGSLLARAGVPDDLITLFRVYNEQVYLAVSSSGLYIRADEGLKQGCPSASPLFCVLATFVLSVVHRLAPFYAPALASVSTLSPFSDGQLPPQSQVMVSRTLQYVDDFAVLIQDSTPVGLLDHISSVSAAVLRAH